MASKIKEVTTLMKKTAFLIAVLALLGVMVSSGPSLAGMILTNTSTLGSSSFGFAPTAANLQAFTRQTGNTVGAGGTPADNTTYVSALTGLSPNIVPTISPQAVVGDGFTCSGTTSLFCTDGVVNAGTGEVEGYVPVANSLPGALTSRPDKVVSQYTDYGCGDQVFGVGAACVENNNATNTVIGINTISRVLMGHNTAPGPNSCGGTLPVPAVSVPCVEGTLTGALNSVIALDNQSDPDMPTGSIVFNWTAQDTPPPAGSSASAVNSNGSATFTVDINHEVSQLYTFNEHDTTLNPVLTYASSDFQNLPDAGGPVGTIHLGDVYPETENIAIRTTLDLTQRTMGGNGLQSETIGYTVDWTGETFGHPGGGNYFSPGLNIRDWVGNVPPAPVPSPPGDGAGFAN